MLALAAALVGDGVHSSHMHDHSCDLIRSCAMVGANADKQLDFQPRNWMMVTKGDSMDRIKARCGRLWQSLWMPQKPLVGRDRSGSRCSIREQGNFLVGLQVSRTPYYVAGWQGRWVGYTYRTEPGETGRGSAISSRPA